MSRGTDAYRANRALRLDTTLCKATTVTEKATQQPPEDMVSYATAATP